MFHSLKTWVFAPVGTDDACSSFQDRTVFIHVIPRDLTNVVVKTFAPVCVCGGGENDASRNESIYDTVIKAKRIGLRFRGYIKAENLFFFFGESVELLRDSIMSFFESRSIPYSPHNLFNSVYTKEGDRDQESYADPLAVVLCKVSDTKPIRDAIGREQRQSRRNHRCCQVSWRELQCIEDVLDRAEHGVTK